MADALTSIRLSDDKIEIVNQLLLPHTTEWLSIDTIEQAHDAIKTMKVSTPAPRSLDPRCKDECAPAVDPWRTGHRLSRSSQRLAAPVSGAASAPSARVPLVTRKPQGARLANPRLSFHRTSDRR